MKKQILLLAAALVLTAGQMAAQGRKGLHINEVMVQNTQNIVDEYGQHQPWVELFNSNFAPLEISSVYLTDDPANPKKYPVPLGDVQTRIAKRQHVVFWIDGQPDRGTFHTNLQFKPGQDNWIGIYDADGRTLIDELTIPGTLPADNSYARQDNGDWVVRNGDQTKYITPYGGNVIKGENHKIQDFAERDSNGFAMTLMAMGIVFSALLILCLCFYAIGELGKYAARVKKARATGIPLESMNRDEHDSGEEIAAITMALHEHLNMHDDESNILTLKRIRRAYSPWSSKIYSLRPTPRR